MKKKGKINCRNIVYISDKKLNQMYKSYQDWCKKNNYSLGCMNMYYPLKYKIDMVVKESFRRLKIKWVKEQNNGNKN